jgi:acyl dehydratase
MGGGKTSEIGLIANLKLNQILPEHNVIANNYGADHANKIHSDDGAAKYGFAGALVPGVGIYAYLTRPVVDALGREWLERGTMKARFLHPIYDGEKVRVAGKVIGLDPVELNLEALNSSGVLCASGIAGLPARSPELPSDDYPFRSLPDSGNLHPASISAFSPGEVLGSLEFTLDFSGEMERFLVDVVETSTVYRGAEAVCHPAFFVSQANEIIMHNVRLGPWIHTSSEIQHYSVAMDGERLSLRGRVIEAFEKRGNEYIVADLGLFSERNRPVARIKHTAIIKLRDRC